MPGDGNPGDVAGGEELFDENRHRLNDFDGHRNLDVGNLEKKIHRLIYLVMHVS